MKKILLMLTLTIGFIAHSQIKIDEIGDNKPKVDSALVLIQTYDLEAYDMVKKHCKHVSFWVSNFSSTQDGNTILISVDDMKLESINNIACLLVHESYHLKMLHENNILESNIEEQQAYIFELKFLSKLPQVESWIKEHVIKMINSFSLENSK